MIHRHRLAISIDSLRCTLINRAAGSKREKLERKREGRKAERIGKSGNFSRKLRRTSDNSGKEKRGMTFGEKVSDLRASIDVEG